MTTVHLKKPSGRAPLQRAFLLIHLALALAWFALSPAAQAQLPSPTPDGGYPGSNTAEGTNALFNLTTGADNTATGAFALTSNTTGNANTATGSAALESNTSGTDNTAIGYETLLRNTTGYDNTAIGVGAGSNADTGNGNVYIGAVSGAAAESNHTYIANINTTSVSGGGTDTVTVDLSTGLLGHLSSSRRYKEEIKPMDKASEALFALKPVSYRFKKEIDQSQRLDYGLIAEEVAEVDPNLAIRDGKGQIEGVRYNAINAMLLNEFLKEHRKVQDLEATVAEQENGFASKIAHQQEQIEAITAGLQKVTAQFELNKRSPQTVVNNK